MTSSTVCAPSIAVALSSSNWEGHPPAGTTNLVWAAAGAVIASVAIL